MIRFKIKCTPFSTIRVPNLLICECWCSYYYTSLFNSRICVYTCDNSTLKWSNIVWKLYICDFCFTSVFNEYYTSLASIVFLKFDYGTARGKIYFTKVTINNTSHTSLVIFIYWASFLEISVCCLRACIYHRCKMKYSTRTSLIAVMEIIV